jgi:hypothetical protein
MKTPAQKRELDRKNVANDREAARAQGIKARQYYLSDDANSFMRAIFRSLEIAPHSAKSALKTVRNLSGADVARLVAILNIGNRGKRFKRPKNTKSDEPGLFG